MSLIENLSLASGVTIKNPGYGGDKYGLPLGDPACQSLQVSLGWAAAAAASDLDDLLVDDDVALLLTRRIERTRQMGRQPK